MPAPRPPSLDAAALARLQEIVSGSDFTTTWRHPKYTDEIITGHGDMITTNDDVHLAESIVALVNAAPALIQMAQAQQRDARTLQRVRAWTESGMPQRAEVAAWNCQVWEHAQSEVVALLRAEDDK